MKKLGLAQTLLNILALFPKKYKIGNKDFSGSPIFVINAGRSGSTLLNRLMNQHQYVFMPSEQYFIHNIIIKFQLYNYILWRDLSKILAGELINSLETHTWEWNYEKVYKEIIHASGKDRTLVNIIDKIMFEYAHQQNKKAAIWGDTTPLSARYIKEIYQVYPNAKYIFLVRDGRDVITSYKAGGGVKPFMQYANHVNGAMNWTNVYHQAWWVSKRAKHYLEIRYENLVTKPQNTLDQIFDFVEVEKIDIQTDGLELPEQQFYKSPFHDNLKNPINSQSIGKWQKGLTKKELDEIMPLIEKPMKALRYL